MLLLDNLSLLFVFLILLGVVPNIFYTIGYLPHIKRKKFFLIHYIVFIVSMLGVVLSNEVIEFLFFWELMSLSSWQLILTESSKESKDAAKFYFFMTHFGFIFILIFFLILSNNSFFISFADLKAAASNFKYPTLLFIFMILGFLSKAGVVPMHVWLPYAHPAAPSPVSALMSGVMLKVAIYAFFRFLFVVLYPWQIEWGILVLILGALSALIGVLYALSEHDIKALLANHSIENIGIILIGFGMGMIFDTLGLKILSSFAFIAALFHTFNHMSFKSLLFMGAGSVLHQTHTKNIEKYGSLIKNMPKTAFFFLIAALSISALPPTNGFISEWMIFQSLLGSSQISDISLKLSIPFAIFALALTGGLAIACFVKAYGITFLGLHRSENSKYAKEVNKMMNMGQASMAFVVISLMLFAPFFVYIFDLALTDLGRESIYDKIFSSVFTMHSVANHGGALSPILILLGLISISWLLSVWYKKLDPKTRVFHTWACGNETNQRSQYSATGFAGPIRRFFDWLYKSEEHRKIELHEKHKNRFKKSFYEVHTKPLFESTLYDGTKRAANVLSYYIYKIAHFEKTRYTALIFNLLILVLFSYRLFSYQFNWATFILEGVIMIILFKILIIGERSSQ